MAPKRIYTRSHPDLNPSKIVDDPGKLVRKKRFTKSQGSNSPLSRFNSPLENTLSRSNFLPEKFETLQDREFDFPFQQSLFRSKSEAFIDQTVIDKAILQPYLPQNQDLETDPDLEFLQQFDKLQDLVSVLDQATEEAFIQQSIEFSALTVAAASLSSQSSQSVHLQRPSPTHSIVSTSLPLISQTTILVVIKTAPPLGPSSSQSTKTVMAGRYAPLVLPSQLNAMPADYPSKIVTFDNTSANTAQHHVDRMNDFFDLQEVDEADVKMRLFAQSLGGDVKKWFRGLPTEV